MSFLQKIKYSSVFVIMFTLSICAMIVYEREQTDMGVLVEGKKMGACYGTIGQDYYRALNVEIQTLIEEQGDSWIVRDANMDQNIQNEQLIQLVDENIAGLFVIPVDSHKIEPALVYAREKGVPVIVLDAIIEDFPYVNGQVATDNVIIGEQIATFMMSQKKGANILILSEQDNVKDEQRIAGFRSQLEEGYTVVDTLYVKPSTQQTYQQLSTISSPIYDTVFCTSDSIAYAMVAYKDQYRLDGLDILSVGGSPLAKRLVTKEDIMVTAAQYTVELASQSVSLMYACLEDKTLYREIEVPTKLITRYTVSSYNLDSWQ